MINWPNRIESIFVSLCVVVTLAVYVVSANSRHQFGNVEFRRLTDDSQQVLRTRMQSYLQTLKGTAAFIRASPRLTLERFEDYASSLNTEKFLPGISGVGMIRAVEHADLEAFVSRTRQDGQPEYAPRKLTGSGTHYLVQYLYPRAMNATALGLDVTYEPAKRAIFDLARTLNDVQLSPPINLVQHDPRQPGYLLILPVFDKPREQDAGERSFAGWVYLPFTAANLFAQLTPSLDASYQFAVFDGENSDSTAPVFASQPEADTSGVYSTTYKIDQFGRPWTIAYTSTARFDAAMHSRWPEITLLIGFLLTVFLILLLRSKRHRSEALDQIMKMRERQIEARDAENKAIVENDVIAIFVLDETGTILFTNRAAQKTFGRGADELAGLAFEEIVTDLLPKAQLCGYSARGRNADGGTLFLDLQKNRWETTDGQTRITAITRDLTREIAAHSELEHAKTLYDMALQSGQIGVFAIEFQSGRMEASQTWWHIMGYADADDTPEPKDVFYKRVHPEDLPALMAAEQACIDGLEERSINEYRVRFGSAEWRWMRSDATVTERDADGGAVRMIGTQSDVTDLMRARNALKESEQRFRQVLEAAPIGTALITETGRFLNVNPAFCALTGLAETDLVGRQGLRDLIPRKDIETVCQGLSKLSQAPRMSVYKAEHQLIHAGGGERWGLLNISRTYKANTASTAYIVQVIDITVQKKLAQLKDEFVATVSHELRTPLTSINGALTLIHATKDASWKPEISRLLDIARKNTERLTSIVNDILDLEKTAVDTVKFDLRPVDIVELVSESIHEMSPFAATHRNQLVLDLPEVPFCITADTRRAKQVLANLISNACKYSHQGTAVTVKAERLNDMGIIFVQNTGPGIPDALRPNIFQAFTQADKSDSRAKGGTGLGLTISKQIVERHGGEIGFESTPGGVTVFWCTFPAPHEDKAGAPGNVLHLQARGADRPAPVNVTK